MDGISRILVSSVATLQSQVLVIQIAVRSSNLETGGYCRQRRMTNKVENLEIDKEEFYDGCKYATQSEHKKDVDDK